MLAVKVVFGCCLTTWWVTDSIAVTLVVAGAATLLFALAIWRHR